METKKERALRRASEAFNKLAGHQLEDIEVTGTGVKITFSNRNLRGRKKNWRTTWTALYLGEITYRRCWLGESASIFMSPRWGRAWHTVAKEIR